MGDLDWLRKVVSNIFGFTRKSDLGQIGRPPLLGCMRRKIFVR